LIEGRIVYKANCRGLVPKSEQVEYFMHCRSFRTGVSSSSSSKYFFGKTSSNSARRRDKKEKMKEPKKLFLFLFSRTQKEEEEEGKKGKRSRAHAESRLICCLEAVLPLFGTHRPCRRWVCAARGSRDCCSRIQNYKGKIIIIKKADVFFHSSLLLLLLLYQRSFSKESSPNN
jgi:hypothetical protein